MGATQITINHVRSRSPSVASDDDILDTGVHVSSHTSPQYSTRGSVRGSQSHSGSSEPRQEFGELPYPSELPERELGPSDSASILASHPHPPVEPSRAGSVRRDLPHRRTEIRDSGRPPAREPAQGSPTESIVSSAEEFARQGYPTGAGMPRPQSYYGNGNGYAYSHSSDSYGHSMGPPPGHGQMVHYAPQPPQPVPYAPQYSHMAPPSHAAYAPPSHANYGMPPMIHQAPSHISSPYSNSPYASPGMMPYGPPMPHGYFPPQYPQPYPPHPQFMEQWRVQSPSQSIIQPPTSAPPPPAEPEKPKVDTAQEELAKRIEAMLLEQKTERLKNEADREGILKAAKEEAAARAEQIANEQRIRDEATAAAMKAAADRAIAEAEVAAREAQIRKEAEAAARQAIADEAKAQAERAAFEAKIADDAAAKAAAAAKEESDAKLAEAKKAADEKQEEAEKKLKEAEKAAEEAKAKAEEAEKAAAANAPKDEKKLPIRFHDAVGRKFNFPFEICAKWRSMEHLIQQAFQHVDVIGDHVMQGHYDLAGPTGEIIMPHVWESVIEPDWTITMQMWPIPEPPPEELPPPLDDGVLNLDDILNPKKSKGKKEKEKEKEKEREREDKGGARKGRSNRPGPFSMWMTGGGSSKGGKSSSKTRY